MTVADRIAGAIGARFSGGWWRTSTEFCHGGDTVDGLAFTSPEDRPDHLRVHCHTRGCHESIEGRNRARDKLRAAAGLPEWRPQETPGDARRRSDRPQSASSAPIGVSKAAESRSERKSGRDRSDTSEYAAQLWAQAAVSTGKAPPEHPVNRWLAGKAEGGLWPAGEPLPSAVRWLPRRMLPAGTTTIADSNASGALVLAMTPLSDPDAPVRKVQLVAIDGEGGKAQHWHSRDKRTYGQDSSAVGVLARDPGWRHDPRPLVLHACEGLADGLRILRYAGEGELVAVVAGAGNFTALEGWQDWFGRILLWPDADPAGLEKAKVAGQRWANEGLDVRIMRLSAGDDPASAPLERS